MKSDGKDGKERRGHDILDSLVQRATIEKLGSVN